MLRVNLLALVLVVIGWSDIDPNNLPLTEKYWIAGSDLAQNSRHWLLDFAKSQEEGGKHLSAANAYQILSKDKSPTMLKAVVRNLELSGFVSLSVLVATRNQIDPFSNHNSETRQEFLEYLDFLEAYHKARGLERFSQDNPYILQETQFLSGVLTERQVSELTAKEDPFYISLYQQTRHYVLDKKFRSARKNLSRFPGKHYFLPHLKILKMIMGGKQFTTPSPLGFLHSGELANLLSKVLPFNPTIQKTMSIYPSLGFSYLNAKQFNLDNFPYKLWSRLLKTKPYQSLCLKIVDKVQSPKNLRKYLVASYRYAYQGPDFTTVLSSQYSLGKLHVHWPNYLHPRQIKGFNKVARRAKNDLKRRNLKLSDLEIWFQEQAQPYTYDAFGSSISVSSQFFGWSLERQTFTLRKACFLHAIIQRLFSPLESSGAVFPFWFFHALVNHFMNWDPEVFGVTENRLRTQVHYPLTLNSLLYLPYSNSTKLDFLLYQYQCKEIGDQIWGEAWSLRELYKIKPLLSTLANPKAFIKKLHSTQKLKNKLLWLEP